ncbi:DUF1573 domain-containing protein [Saprospiraceae bacterium]|nr:DUF1573 domain-containing protein [Saprospiraceae bacterium]
MKNLFLVCLLVLGVSAFATAQQTPAPVTDQTEMPAEGPVMSFETPNCDFGTIEQNSDRDRFVKFTNTGTEPLVISNARGSCGCTVPVWPKEPIMPGEAGEIKITYATNRLGKINKTVTLTTNEGGKPHVIKVLGMVNKKEDAVPAAAPSVLGGGN